MWTVDGSYRTMTRARSRPVTAGRVVWATAVLVAVLVLSTPSHATFPGATGGAGEVPLPFGDYSSFSRPTLDELIHVYGSLLADELPDLREELAQPPREAVQIEPAADIPAALAEVESWLDEAGEHARKLSRIVYELQRALFGGDYRLAHHLAGDGLEEIRSNRVALARGHAVARSIAAGWSEQVGVLEEYRREEGMSSLQLFSSLQEGLVGDRIPEGVALELEEAGLSPDEIAALGEHVAGYDPAEVAVSYERIRLGLWPPLVWEDDSWLVQAACDLTLLREGLARTRIDLVEPPATGGWWAIPGGSDPVLEAESRLEGRHSYPLAPGFYDVYTVTSEGAPRLLAEEVNVPLGVPAVVAEVR